MTTFRELVRMHTDVVKTLLVARSFKITFRVYTMLQVITREKDYYQTNVTTRQVEYNNKLNMIFFQLTTKLVLAYIIFQLK